MAHFSLRIPDDLHAHVSDLAAADGQTMSAVITDAITRHVERLTVRSALAHHTGNTARQLFGPDPHRPAAPAPPLTAPAIPTSGWELTLPDIDAALSALRPLPRWRNRAGLHDALSSTNHALSQAPGPGTVHLAAAHVISGFAAHYPLSDNNASDGLCVGLGLLAVYGHPLTLEPGQKVSIILDGVLARISDSAGRHHDIIPGLAHSLMDLTEGASQ